MVSQSNVDRPPSLQEPPMVVSLIIAAALAAGAVADNPIQTPPPLRQDPATELGEIVVSGERTREAAEAFVRTVTAPPPGREAAVWDESVCVGVVGMQPEAARFMVDRVSDWAHSVGLRVEAPGCRADILIVAADDGDAMAREMVAAQPDEFMPNMGDADRGRAALERFQTSGAPIRWWHVSLVVNEDTGQPIRRLPGQKPFTAPGGAITKPSDLGPWAVLVQPSRINDQSRDDLRRAVVIVDTDALDTATFAQVTDYVAMVALAQIDPDTTPETPSILRLFTAGEAQQDTLSRWDQAYLRALYSAHQGRASTESNMSAIAAALARELEDETTD
jgi:hypothetical protein